MASGIDPPGTGDPPPGYPQQTRDVHPMLISANAGPALNHVWPWHSKIRQIFKAMNSNETFLMIIIIVAIPYCMINLLFIIIMYSSFFHTIFNHTDSSQLTICDECWGRFLYSLEAMRAVTLTTLKYLCTNYGERRVFQFVIIIIF